MKRVVKHHVVKHAAAHLGAHLVTRAFEQTVLLSAMLLAFSAAELAAQTVPPPGAPVKQGARARQERPGTPGERAVMERRLQDRIDSFVRKRLGVNEEQLGQLRAISARMEGDRRALRREEIVARGELRRALQATDGVNEARVAELLEQLPKLERRRIDLFEQEQRELARFLQPSQRAHYFALQDQLRREMQEGQRRRMGSDSGDRPAAVRRNARPGPPSIDR